METPSFDIILSDYIIPWVIRIVLAIVIYIIGRWLAGFAKKIVQRHAAKTELTESMITLVTSLVYYGIVIVSLLGVLAVLGVPLTALAAMSGVVIIALGIALQDSISNLAATINFMLFKPYVVGDLVETSGFIGVVREVQIFGTEFLTADQKVIVLANSNILNSGTTNYSKIGILRADMAFGISYDDDIRKAKGILEEIAASDERVLADPPTQVIVKELADSAVVLALMPFVKSEDNAPVKASLTELVKVRFDEEGISMPFPARDVYIHQSEEEKKRLQGLNIG